MSVKRLLKPLLALAALCIFMGGGEVVLRFFFRSGLDQESLHPDAARRYAAAHMLSGVEEDGLRYMGTPNASVTIRGVLYRHNSLGLREREIPLRKPPDVFRVLMLGDSNTYGWGVPLEQTFGRRTEELLAESGRTAARVQFINAGFPGYNNGDEEALYRRIAERIDPDLVLLVWYINDLERLGFHLSGDGYLFCDPLPLPSAWKPTLWHSYLYRRVSVWKLGRMRTDGSYVLAKGANLTYSADRIATLAREVRARGRRFALVDLPLLEPSPNTSRLTVAGYKAGKESAWLEALAHRESIPLLALLDAVKGEHAAAYWYLIDPPDHHPNRLAHERFATGLADFLLREELVPLAR